MAARSGRESALKRAVMEYLEEHLPQAVVRKRHGTVYGISGDPDIYFLVDGRHVECELKRLGEEPTPLQAKRLRQWERAGALAVVVHSVTELKQVLAGLGVE